MGASMDWPDGTRDATRLGEDWHAHALPQWATHDFLGVARSLPILRNSEEGHAMPSRTTASSCPTLFNIHIVAHGLGLMALD